MGDSIEDVINSIKSQCDQEAANKISKIWTETSNILTKMSKMVDDPIYGQLIEKFYSGTATKEEREKCKAFFNEQFPLDEKHIHLRKLTTSQLRSLSNNLEPKIQKRTATQNESDEYYFVSQMLDTIALFGSATYPGYRDIEIVEKEIYPD